MVKLFEVKDLESCLRAIFYFLILLEASQQITIADLSDLYCKGLWPGCYIQYIAKLLCFPPFMYATIPSFL